ncbi:MAG: hypothetical protein HOC91_14735 [Nitrospinaceae bacterium]|nr:hypothetical protein [Nitrospinaceae bacterium]MBT3433691.1 hypothetical protein [Nitrospinaceae bacterium]MBT3821477.1 hypothetical protein [Nitrospinaceae bacterium]MBT4431763.1 hypothetical protein [Nitrospinaceae bacterium]MBT5369259.1 hypothetical protein [Nitrospinaceae bacterium]
MNAAPWLTLLANSSRVVGSCSSQLMALSRMRVFLWWSQGGSFQLPAAAILDHIHLGLKSMK